jgi:hypothetical protein
LQSTTWTISFIQEGTYINGPLIDFSEGTLVFSMGFFAGLEKVIEVLHLRSSNIYDSLFMFATCLVVSRLFDFFL